MSKNKKKFYAVAKGNTPGLYTEWFGLKGAEVQINGFPGAQYKGFPTEAEAKQWLEERGVEVQGETSRKASKSAHRAVSDKDSRKGSGASSGERIRAVSGREARAASRRGARAKSGGNLSIQGIPEKSPDPSRVIVYTDGSSMGNPGPGGWGMVRLTASGREEKSGGFKLTTNNRMELLACIEGLKDLPVDTSVQLYSDSQYVVNAINKGWAERWRARGWMRNQNDRAENADLWADLLGILFDLDVEFIWVRGHAGNPGNERCDQLATQAALGKQLTDDPGYPPKHVFKQQNLL